MWLSQKQVRISRRIPVVGCKFFEEVFMRSVKRLFLKFLAVLPLAGVAFAAQTALATDCGVNDKTHMARGPGGGTSGW